VRTTRASTYATYNNVGGDTPPPSSPVVGGNSFSKPPRIQTAAQERSPNSTERTRRAYSASDAPAMPRQQHSSFDSSLRRSSTAAGSSTSTGRNSSSSSKSIGFSPIASSGGGGHHRGSRVAQLRRGDTEGGSTRVPGSPQHAPLGGGLLKSIGSSVRFAGAQHAYTHAYLHAVDDSVDLHVRMQCCALQQLLWAIASSACVTGSHCCSHDH
jgi:hypothetical protein